MTPSVPPGQAPFKAGFAAILGLPNSGKSTLLNRLLRFKLSVVSPLPQTTRHKILGIVNGDGHQLCLLDTPGFLARAQDGLQKRLIAAARSAAHGDADVVLVLAEPGPPGAGLEALADVVRSGSPVILAVNKIDAAPAARVSEALESCGRLLAPAESFPISALRGDGVDSLLSALVRRLPESPPFYEAGQLSDRWERFFASEIIRGAIFELLRQEVPHACAAVIDDFRERAGQPDEVRATVYVERESQKGILIGAGGRMIRELTARSLAGIQELLGRPAQLELRIAVRRNWRKDPRALEEFGYAS